MDNQTARIISTLFCVIGRALPDDVRLQICQELECLRTSSLVKEPDRNFYAILLDTFSQPIAETADELIADTPLAQRASRLHPLKVITGGASNQDNAQLEGGDVA